MGDRDTRHNISFQMFLFQIVTLFCLLSGQWDPAFPTIDIRLMDVSDDRVISYSPPMNVIFATLVTKIIFSHSSKYFL